jgi:monoamine oxidase
VLLGTAVRAVRWRRGEVRLEVESAAGPLPPLEARRAVITLPVSILQAAPGGRGEVRFDPEVSGHRNAAGRLAMGRVVKLVLRFREAFWEIEAFPAVEGGGRLADLGFLLSRDPHYPTWWTALPVRAAILTAWAAGPAAERLGGMTPLERVRAALDSLARLLGASRDSIAGRLQACYTHDWLADPYSLGAYSFVPVGGFGAREALARPVEDTLFWAGEATHTEGQHATVAGAIATGYRAADEVLTVERSG